MRRCLLVAIVSLLFIVQCGTKSDDAPLPEPLRAEGYVYVEDGAFMIDGAHWFPLMLNYKACMREVGDTFEVVPAGYYHGMSMREHFDTIASWGFDCLRVCLDNMSEEEDTAAMFRATRRMVETAENAGLKVMLLVNPPFGKYWEDYTCGLLRRLADMPTVWAFDFMNEPLYFDPVKERTKEDAVAVSKRWCRMVRENAPSQLFTIATAEPIEVFEWDPSILCTDFIEMHTYSPLRAESEMLWYSRYCGKPWMVGETGLPADGDSIPFDWQKQFLYETYRTARINGACGYGWWEFQDNPDGVNFEARYTGLSTVDGTPKPASDLVRLIQRHIICLGVETDEDINSPVNYYNMLAYQNVAVVGTVVDENGEPIDGAVVRGWNGDWSVGMNTYARPDGTFRLVSNDICTHFEVSAPGYSKIKFDRRLGYPANISLPDKEREYQTIDYRPYLSTNGFLPDDPSLFAAPDAMEASMGVLKLRRLSF